MDEDLIVPSYGSYPLPRSKLLEEEPELQRARGTGRASGGSGERGDSSSIAGRATAGTRAGGGWVGGGMAGCAGRAGKAAECSLEGARDDSGSAGTDWDGTVAKPCGCAHQHQKGCATIRQQAC